ncbi:nitroreductase family protein [Hoyosella rhizosphaerae]|uniref:NAD(P)H nitroreductase n=1 Tax=Hoyosella rhizosphaerae TaxID=1755582 RepID=A0A916U4K9_9ACTN|nr:nitroreductase family protein [Hoyosella rhizosphaerae]MBN4926540.1 nitroreductase family protein [Hoyosella rhizosphaerae]GGC58463.1 NAD(P)H nitroreductase [Hoyosella rhizosphaerae]
MDTLKVPEISTQRNAVDMSRAAPSVHNSQPWLWTTDGRTLTLLLDRSRTLATADPNGRQSIISCGAMVHHVQLALEAEGWDVSVSLLPGESRYRLAELHFSPGNPNTDARALMDAMANRRTDRRPYRSLGADADDTFAALAQRAGHYGCSLVVVRPDLMPLIVEASNRSAAAHRYDTNYHHEMHWWLGARTRSDGIPSSALSEKSAKGVGVGRDFHTERGTLSSETIDDHAHVLVISTDDDSVESWLRAGQALSAVLLEATARGVASCTLTHITEGDDVRSMTHRAASQSGTVRAVPQVAVRVGKPTGPQLAATPRRKLEDVFEYS